MTKSISVVAKFATRIKNIEEINKFMIAISITKTSSKIYKLKLYNEVINNPIYDQRQYKGIKDKL